jgi:hypothetical protein
MTTNAATTTNETVQPQSNRANTRLRTNLRAGEVGAVSRAYKGDTDRFTFAPGRDAIIQGWADDGANFANGAY